MVGWEGGDAQGCGWAPGQTQPGFRCRTLLLLPHDSASLCTSSSIPYLDLNLLSLLLLSPCGMTNSMGGTLGNLNEAELTRWVPHTGGEGCEKWLFPEGPCTWGEGWKWGSYQKRGVGRGRACNRIKVWMEQPHSHWLVFWRWTPVCVHGGDCGHGPATQLNGSAACGRPWADSWHWEQFLNKSEEYVLANTLSSITEACGKDLGTSLEPSNLRESSWAFLWKMKAGWGPSFPESGSPSLSSPLDILSMHGWRNNDF